VLKVLCQRASLGLAPDLAAAFGAITYGGGDEEVWRAAARVLAPLQRALL